MRAVLEQVLSRPAGWVYLLVAAMVFAEDAIFVGFVIPGESAALLAGVAAERGHPHLFLAVAVVVAAAIAGDEVGYQVGRRRGSRVLAAPLLRRRRARIDAARRGGTAVFAGRFLAFFRAVMPALAGTARMPYHRFSPWNVAGALVRGSAFVLIGYLACASYQQVAACVGRGGAIAVAVAAATVVVAWRVRRSYRRREEQHGCHAAPRPRQSATS